MTRIFADKISGPESHINNFINFAGTLAPIIIMVFATFARIIRLDQRKSA
jgi:hypothetical protein